jgi:hypothetical protein
VLIFGAIVQLVSVFSLPWVAQMIGEFVTCDGSQESMMA